VAAITEELLGEHPTSLLYAHQGSVTAKKIFQAATQGDALALERIAQTAYWLGIGIASIVHMIDPGLVVLGGAMDFGGAQSPIGVKFLKDTVASFRDRSFDHVFAGTTVAFAKLGSDAGFLGAAGIARHQERYPRRGKQDTMSL
jgi:glucokinase